MPIGPTWDRESDHLQVILKHIFKYSLINRDSDKPMSLIRVNYEEDKNYMTLNIRDNGKGVKEQDLTKIFDDSYTSDSSFRNIGIGLYVVKERMQIIKGEIKLRSKEGRGNEFELSLPYG